MNIWRINYSDLGTTKEDYIEIYASDILGAIDAFTKIEFGYSIKYNLSRHAINYITIVKGGF